MSVVDPEIRINPVLLQKVQSALNDPSYREMIENAAQFNSRLGSERTMRLPFLDSQTGVAQNHSNLFMEAHQRLPGMKDGQVYTYPSKRWQKKRRQYLNTFMQPRYNVRKENGDSAEASTSVLAVEGSSFPIGVPGAGVTGGPPVPNVSGIGGSTSGGIPHEENKEVQKEEVSKQDWYFDELDVPDAGEFDEPDADSDYDYEESYSKRKKRKTPAKPPRQQNKTRRKITYDPAGDSEKPFACDLCGARYKTRPGLTYHYTHSHKEKEDEEEDLDLDKRVTDEARRRSIMPPPPVLHPQQPLPPTLQPQQPHPHPPPHHMAMTSQMPPPSMMHPHHHHHQPPPHLIPQQPPHMGHPHQHQQMYHHQTPPPNTLPPVGPYHHHPPQPHNPMQPPPPMHHQHHQGGNIPTYGTPGRASGGPGPSGTVSAPTSIPPHMNPNHPPSSAPSSSQGSNVEDPNFPKKTDEHKPRVPASPYCDFCLGDAVENKKSGGPEELVSCSDCGRSGHPTCLQFTANMIISVKKYRWQCIECKCCSLCGTSDNDDQLLFCDDCDRGYHMYCLVPKLDSPPEGSWSCTLCLAEFHKK